MVISWISWNGDPCSIPNPTPEQVDRIFGKYGRTASLDAARPAPSADVVAAAQRDMIRRYT